MTPHAFYKGCLKDMRTHLGEPKAFCAYCRQPFASDDAEYCSDACAEDHDTMLKGGMPLPEHERCLGAPCVIVNTHGQARRYHLSSCPLFVPHPEDYTHPLENEP
jgi:hypothetical protein